MAENTRKPPSYVRAATVNGMVLLRRSATGLWAGRAMKKLEFAKKGLLSDDGEVLEWKEVRNSCAICARHSGLRVLWAGTGREKPFKPPGMRPELRDEAFKPVKVLDALICGRCRVESLPRVTFYTQWDITGKNQDPRTCTCKWNGERLIFCQGCQLLANIGRLMIVERAEGWQVRRYMDPLERIRSGKESTVESPREGHEEQEMSCVVSPVCYEIPGQIWGVGPSAPLVSPEYQVAQWVYEPETLTPEVSSKLEMAV